MSSKSKKKKKKDIQAAELEQLADEEQLSSRSVVVPGTDNLVVEVLDREDRDTASTKTRDVVSYNPLTAYLREMRNFPKLSREEEKELAVQYRENKDLEAAYQLVSSNLWLVVKIARDYEKAAKSLLDLIQEGNIGLMEAVKNFDPYRGVRFPSYAVWWIKAYIVRYLIANWRMVKIGTTQAQRKLFFNLQKEKEKLERDGFYPGPKLLAEKLDVKEKEIVEMQQRLGSPDVSVDAPLPGDSDGSLLSVLPDEQISAEEAVVQKEFSSLMIKGLNDFKENLNEKELEIYERRMLSEEKATLQDLSDSLSISKERVRQIENKIKEKLKAFFEERFGSAIEGFNF